MKEKEKMGILNQNERNKKVKLIIAICALLGIILIIIASILIFSKFNKRMTIEELLKNKESGYVYVIDSRKNKCEICNEIKDYMDNKKIDYILLDISKYDSKELNSLKEKASLTKDNMNYPAIIYYKNGMKYSSFNGLVDKSNIDTFIDTIKSNISE